MKPEKQLIVHFVVVGLGSVGSAVVCWELLMALLLVSCFHLSSLNHHLAIKLGFVVFVPEEKQLMEGFHLTDWIDLKLDRLDTWSMCSV